MCGIAGFLNLRNQEGAEELGAKAAAMADAILHRGPDDGGVWVDPQAGLALASRRLAVIDVSPAGHQPMLSSCGRYVIAYNGEVYSHQEIRRDLEALGKKFHGHSDTEVVLESCATFGVGGTVARLIGMFAFALWDRDQRRLTLVRDRLGIKPLYVGRFGDVLIFGSELKALAAYPGWSRKVNRDAAAVFMRSGYVTGNATIFEGVERLGAGCAMMIGPTGSATVERYWSARDVVLGGLRDPLLVSDDEAVNQLESLLLDAVGRRVVADVPLGAFLSGGIDSSTVVALMQAASNRPVRTFSIGFHEKEFNEANEAKRVAAHLGTNHTELYVDSKMAQDVIPRLPMIYDEPFGDSSQIPTLLLCELTRRHVTVALSGDGGDELFGGYDRYSMAERRWRTLRTVPQPLRRASAGVLRAMLRLPMPNAVSRERWNRFASVLPARDEIALYRHYMSFWRIPDATVRGGHEPQCAFKGLARDLPYPLTRMQLMDMVDYLPDDILVKVDRASMAVSLEVRVPLLDHRVVQMAFRLPAVMRRRGKETKWLLRRVLSRYVPSSLFDRPKMGFGVPVGNWIRGPLRDWAENLLSRQSIEAYGLLNPDPVRRLWREHLDQKENWQYELWPTLMLQAWCVRWSPQVEGS